MKIRISLSFVSLLGCVLSCQKPHDDPRPQVMISPSKVTLTSGHSLRFGYQLSHGVSLPLTWKVTEQDGGSVASDGTYKAPDNPGTFTVLAEPADPIQIQGVAKVRVVPNPMGRIMAPKVVRIGATGLRAEVPSQEDSTYLWSIEGGQITSIKSKTSPGKAGGFRM